VLIVAFARLILSASWEDSWPITGPADGRPDPQCRNGHARLRPQAIRCPVCLSDFRGPAVAIAASELDIEKPWGTAVNSSPGQTARLATIALIIGSVSLLWLLLGGLVIGPLLAAVGRFLGHGQGAGTLQPILGLVPGYAAIAGCVYSIVQGRRALRASGLLTGAWVGS
jgi:hypothetical protein